MGHGGCDGSQASGPWAIGSGYRFSIKQEKCKFLKAELEYRGSPNGRRSLGTV